MTLLTVKQAAFLAAMTSEPQSMTRRIHRNGGVDPDSAARVVYDYFGGISPRLIARIA